MASSTASHSRWTEFPSFGRSVCHTPVPVDAVDHLLGRDLAAAAPPAHFSRVLYVPRHDRRVAHLPLYDVSDNYARAVGAAPMGSSKYRVSLALMRRPTGEGGGHVEYLFNVYGGGRGVLEARRGDDPFAETVVVSLPGSGSGTFTIDSPGAAGGRGTISASFPLADQRTSGGTIRYPYFDVDVAGRERWQWQIRPFEHGSLRYTLVRAGDDLRPEVMAVYHHVGVGINLPADYSEGVLLLPEGGAEAEGDMAVASLLGLLWQVRDMHAKTTRSAGSLKKFFGRR